MSVLLAFPYNYCNTVQLFPAVPAPYCGDFQTNYAGAPNVGDPATVEYMDDCAEKCADLNAADPACAADPDACPCQNWYLHVAYAGPKTCQLRGAKATPGEAGVDVAVPENWFFFGSKDCAKKSVAPAMPEDAEELGYKEVCVGDQYDDETRVNNTWSVEDCPSPCLNNGDCPQYAECIDESDDTGPKHKCKCQLGLFMEGGKVREEKKNNYIQYTNNLFAFANSHFLTFSLFLALFQCVNLPPSTPTPRPQPELKPGLKDLTNAARTYGPDLDFAKCCCCFPKLSWLYSCLSAPPASSSSSSSSSPCSSSPASRSSTPGGSST